MGEGLMCSLVCMGKAYSGTILVFVHDIDISLLLGVVITFR